MGSKTNKSLLIITSMMLEENDEHAALLEKMNKRYSLDKYNHTLLNNLNLIHDIKIKLLEEVYNRIKEI